MKCSYCGKKGHRKNKCPKRDSDTEQFSAGRFPQKFSTGVLAMGCPAPPRWEGEMPRKDWTDGVLFHILSEPMLDHHSWGGLYNAICLSGPYTGKRTRVHGDFLLALPGTDGD